MTRDKRCCSTYGIYFASITKVAEYWRVAHHVHTKQTRKLWSSRLVTRRATELLCTSDNCLKWLAQSKVYESTYLSDFNKIDDFIENRLDMLVPALSLLRSLLMLSTFTTKTYILYNTNYFILFFIKKYLKCVYK